MGRDPGNHAQDSVPTLGLRSLHTGRPVSCRTQTGKLLTPSQTSVPRKGPSESNSKFEFLGILTKKKKQTTFYLECSYLDKRLRARDLGPAGVH